MLARKLIVQLAKGFCGVRVGADLDELDPHLGQREIVFVQPPRSGYYNRLWIIGRRTVRDDDKVGGLNWYRRMNERLFQPYEIV